MTPASKNFEWPHNLKPVYKEFLQAYAKLPSVLGFLYHTVLQGFYTPLSAIFGQISSKGFLDLSLPFPRDRLLFFL